MLLSNQRLSVRSRKRIARDSRPPRVTAFSRSEPAAGEIGLGSLISTSYAQPTRSDAPACTAPALVYWYGLGPRHADSRSGSIVYERSGTLQRRGAQRRDALGKRWVAH